MVNEKIELPSVSVIVSTFNCREDAKKCFERLINQDYPKEKVELIATDSYSTDGTIETLEKMGVKVIKSHTTRPEGVGQAKWIAHRESNGEIFIVVDSDVTVMQKDWIRKMIKPLIENKSIDFCVSPMMVDKRDPLITQYLSLIGTDPFLAYKSFDGLYHSGKLNLADNGEYYTFNITPKNFIIVGGYAIAIRKKTIDDLGGYSQDIDMSYKLVKRGNMRVAIPKGVSVHHDISRSLKHFIFKKYKLARIYFEQGHKDREYNWDLESKGEMFRVGLRAIWNLMFVPTWWESFKLYFKEGKRGWLIHPYVTWLATVSYLLAYLTQEKDLEKSKFKSQGGI